MEMVPGCREKGASKLSRLSMAGASSPRKYTDLQMKCYAELFLSTQVGGMNRLAMSIEIAAKLKCQGVLVVTA